MVDAEIKQRCEMYRDWEVDFLEKQYYDFQGATRAQIQVLVDFAGCSLPEDYLDFLRFTNGFLDLSAVEDVIANTVYFRQYGPGGLAVGSDANEGFFFLNLRGNEIFAMSYAHMTAGEPHWEQADVTWPDFKALFLDVTPSELY